MHIITLLWLFGKNLMYNIPNCITVKQISTKNRAILCYRQIRIDEQSVTSIQITPKVLSMIDKHVNIVYIILYYYIDTQT